jgi:hypothetical protein
LLEKYVFLLMDNLGQRGSGAEGDILMKKLDIHNVASLTAFAVEKGLINQ